MSLSQNVKTPIWGLTGGIGSGKSLAAKFFLEQGIAVINLDNLGKKIIEENIQVHQGLKSIFGPSVFLENKKPNKKRIQQLIFEDLNKRKKLEELLHPLIWDEFQAQALIEAQKGTKLILCEAALLIEHGHGTLFPRLIVVMADEEIRQKRVQERDHLSQELINQIINSQVSDIERKKHATDILINNESAETLRQKVQTLIAGWKSQSLF